MDKVFAGVPGNPPQCHLVINVIAAFFIPVLGHSLARPGDCKSPSFFLVFLPWLFSFIVRLFLDINLDFVLYPILFVCMVWAIIVCFISEKNRPPKEEASDSAPKK
jgi:hypothetical protein